MFTSEEQLKKNFAKNLADLRKRAGMTQLELAEKLNYSDKSISKWERAEGIPDIYMVSCIAELFEVTINDLLSEKAYKKPLFSRNKLLTTILSIGIAWLVAVTLFFVFQVSVPTFPAWYFYVYALPVSAVIAIVFSYLWWNKLTRFISVSSLVWSVALCIMLTFMNTPRMWLIFAVAAVVEILTILVFLRKSNK